MATFAANFTGVQSSDGTKVTLTDTSNWSDNTEGYIKSDFTRIFTINDAYGNLIDTLDLVLDYIDKDIVGNPWYEITFTITNINDSEIVFTKLLKFPLDRLFQLKFLEVEASDCDCGCEDSKIGCDVLIKSRTASYASSTGNGVLYQRSIDNAYNKLCN